MATSSTSDAPSFEPEQLLGPLNDVERRNAPQRLFTTGDVGLLRAGPRVALVGARRASELGLRRAARLSRYLIEQRVILVSGLAEGVDRVAHETAIERGGRTIAVIGTGLDIAYPAKHGELQRRIATEHLLLSQFPAGTPIRRGNFPQRNRTMALLSDASVIIEASETSGTLSQGWEALRLGRPLFLLKSVVETSGLSWPQEMLRHGAMVLSEPEQILAVLPSGHGGWENIAF